MRGLLPFSGIQTIADVGTLALSTTAALFNRFSAVGVAMCGLGTGTYGDPAVRNDLANNRLILNGPGVYRITIDGNFLVDSAADLTFAVRKNGTAVNGIGGTYRIGTTNTGMNCVGYLTVTEADGVTGGLATFPEPAAAVSPAVSFTGASGAPKTGVPVDITVAAASGTPTLTAGNVRFLAERVA